MLRLFMFLGITLGGAVGWWLGELVGFMTAFLLSGVGSMFGVYLGWRIHRHFFG